MSQKPKKVLFEFAVVFNPDEPQKGFDEGVIASGTVLAVDAQSARLVASRRVPEKYDSVIQYVEVYVRPFARTA